MRKRNLSKKRRSSKVKRRRDPIPWKYCFLTLVCGLILVVGFFWAARQHFSSMDYGMKNAKLRKQIEDLKSEKRRLKLAKEVSLSPAEIKKSAKKLGLTTMTARNIEVIEKKKSVEIKDKNKKDEKKDTKPQKVKEKSKTDKSQKIEEKKEDKSTNKKGEKIKKSKSTKNTKTKSKSKEQLAKR